jgi:hypothetical protein
MLKGILNSLKNGCGVSSNWLRAKGFNYLIKDSYVRLFYSIRFKVSFLEVQDVLKTLTNNETFYKEAWKLCGLHYIGKVNDDSFNSDLKAIYQKYKGNLEGFNDFYQELFNILTYYHVYDIVFYNPTAIEYNKDFSYDRNVAYLTTVPEYLDVLVYANASYIVIYENQKPIATLWAVTSKDYNNIAFFNRIGKEFHRLDTLFSNEELKHIVSNELLVENLGIPILYTNDIYVYENSFKDFRYELNCPYCDRHISSELLIHTKDGLRCFYCKESITKRKVKTA